MDNAKVTSDNKKEGFRMPPALNPEQAALVQPYREFVATGLISSLKVEFTGGTISVNCNLGGHVKVPDGQTREGLAPGLAKQLIVSSGLWAPKGTKKKGDKKKEEAPKRTLTKRDFEASEDEFRARVLSVAKELGPSTARGRIGSLQFMVKGIDTFEKWWSRVPDSAKARILMDGKHHAQMTPELFQRMGGLKCPFLGSESVPTPTEEEDEEPEEQEKKVGPSSPPKGKGGSTS